MNIIDDRIPRAGHEALQLATRIQVMHSPALGTGFYQWLLQRARAGVKVEVLIAAPDGTSQSDLTPQYYQHLDQAGGRVFWLPESQPLQTLILLDEVALLHHQDHASNPAFPGFILELRPDAVQKLNVIFNQWKASGRMSADALVLPHPIRIYLEATPLFVTVNEKFELTWNVGGATQVTIQPHLGIVPEKGRRILSAEKTTEFCLTASLGEHSVSSVVTVTVSTDPKIEYFLTVPGTSEQDDLVMLPPLAGHPDQYGVVKGQAICLYWRVYNAEQVAIDGRIAPSAGHEILTPDQIRAYSITATGHGKEVKKTIVIDVFQRPEIEQLSLTAPVHIQPAAQSPNVGYPTTTIPVHHQDKSNAELPIPIPSPLSSPRAFFWFCSGASRELLQQCPAAEGNKYVGIGATVFFTGLLAAMSGAYALYVAFQNILGALLFGILWGAAIFNLDRLIVSTIKKEAGPSRQWLQALPRFLLALVLSVVIAKPLELRVFKPEIDEILSEKRTEKLNRTAALFQEKASIIETQINQLKAETEALFKVRENLYQEYRCECDGTCGTGKTGRGSECARKEAKYQQSDREYQALKATNDVLIAGAREQTSQLKEAEQKSLQSIETAHSDGLVSRLSASGDLPFLPSFFIALLIFMIEIAPVLSKILAPRGSYDAALQAEEARFNLSQQGLLQQQQLQTDHTNELNIQLHQADLNQALEHKREMLRIIAGAQVQLVQEKVDLWLKEERKKLRSEGFGKG